MFGIKRPRGGRGGRYKLTATLSIAVLLLAGCVAGPDVSRNSSMLARGSCGTQLGPEFDRPVDSARPDPRLAAEAIRVVTNRERCRRGLEPLGAAPKADRAAQWQARAMARHGFVAHKSPVKGEETLVRRLQKAAARYRIAGENVAATSLFALHDKPYVPIDTQRCIFRRASGGAPVPQQTYRMLAERLVSIWMRSPAHRENMLRGNYRGMGAGVSIQTGRPDCGRVSAATVFLG